MIEIKWPKRVIIVVITASNLCIALFDILASSTMDTLEQPGNRLQAYKRLKTEPDDIKAARKLLEGVKLRREERDKQVKFSSSTEPTGYQSIQKKWRWFESGYTRLGLG